MINELDNTVVAYSYDAAGGALAPVQTVSVLPPGFAGASTAAEVRVHPNGRFLYGSSRGSDTIAVFAVDAGSGRLSPVEIVPCGGKAPRNFTLTERRRRGSSAPTRTRTRSAPSRSTPRRGRLRRIPGTVSVSMPVCVVFAG